MATLSLKNPSTRVTKSSKPALSRNDIHKARKEKSDQAQQWLSREYPAVFNVFKPLPLVIGCGQVIIKARPAGTSGKTMVRALNCWTRRQAYQNAIATGDFRYNLDGTPAAAISDAHRKYARDILEK